MTVKKLLILCALITIAFILCAWWQGELCHADTMIINDTDAMTGYVGAGDGTYLTARNKTTGDAAGGNGAFGYIGQTTGFTVTRGFFTFQTNTIPDNATISSAYVKIVDESEIVDGGDFTFYLAKGTQDTTSNIASAWFNDFDGWAASGNYTLTTIAGAYNTADIVPTDSLTFTLNAAGIAYINKSGYTRFALISEEDRVASQPTGNELFYPEDDSPYISVTYTVPSIAGESRGFLYLADKQYLYNSDKVYLWQP